MSHFDDKSRTIYDSPFDVLHIFQHFHNYSTIIPQLFYNAIINDSDPKMCKYKLEITTYNN